jgi:adenine-specific DNA-methyltransferase
MQPSLVEEASATPHALCHTDRSGATPLRPRSTPHFIKYMGSKSKIIDFVVSGLNEVYSGGGICDLFAGSCTIGGSLGHCVPIYSNDIQEYSKVLSEAYLIAWRDPASFMTGREIVDRAGQLVESHSRELPKLYYSRDMALQEFREVERHSQELINARFSFKYHLFTRYYSGTWWSADQCLWIDAIREVADTQKGSPHYSVILASLMYAMAYCGQGTGHYAQYRDASTRSAMRDILNYRLRRIDEYFLRKYEAVTSGLAKTPPVHKHEITAQDYRDRLRTLPRCTVYADPPYCFVHYSRFYHAIETLVKYDYPQLQRRNGEVVKGRYRLGRHQSPFCIRSRVADAFVDLFDGVGASRSNLVLSYSNTGMISLEDLMLIARQRLLGYTVWCRELDSTHMTMGRRNDRDRAVKEYLINARCD